MTAPAPRGGPAYGWVARLGVVCPSTNAVLEPELWRLAPPGITVHVARAYQNGPQASELYTQIAANVARATEELASADVAVFAFGCTSYTYFVPAAEIRARMAGAAGGRLVLCTSDAVLAAIRHMGITLLALATPRTEFVNRWECAWLAERGIDVVSVRVLQRGATAEARAGIGRISPDEAFDLALAADHPEAEALFISCTNFITLPIIEALESACNKPVITSNQATMWALAAVGHRLTVQGAGSLLRHPRPEWTLPLDG